MLDQPPGKQALPAERLGHLLVHSIEFSCGLRLITQIDGLRRAALHPEGEFIRRYAGGQFGIARVLLEVRSLSLAKRSSRVRCCSAVIPSGGLRSMIGSPPEERNAVP